MLMPGLSRFALRDHADVILNVIADDMDPIQSDFQQREKSKGEGGTGPLDRVGIEHATVRIEAGFDMEEVVAEFRALRASVARLWKESASAPATTDLEDLTRFNEGIDQALAESVSEYRKKLDYYRDQFLGIAGHDLRNPLSSIVLASATLLKAEGVDVESSKDRGTTFTMRLPHPTVRSQERVS